MTKFVEGDTFGPNIDGIYTAGIHDIDGWGNRIECYGHSEEAAIKLRDKILKAITE